VSVKRNPLIMDNLIPLSSIDHIFTGLGSYPIEFIFAYEGQIDPEKLIASLKETMKYFPPASARLTRLSDEAYAFNPMPECYSIEVGEGVVSFEDTAQREIFIDPVETFENEILTRIRLTQTPAGSQDLYWVSACRMQSRMGSVTFSF
jgi:hypothetical protein